MKKLICIALTLVMLLSALFVVAVPTTAEEPAEPITPDTSWYDPEADILFISDAADLLGMAALAADGNCFTEQTIELTADIDLNPGWTASYKVENGAAVYTAPANAWTGIPAFYGSFDGRGHTISGLYRNVEMAPVSGWVAHTGGFINEIAGGKHMFFKNVAFVNSLFICTSQEGGMGNKGIGGLIGMLKAPTFEIDNVYSDMTVVYINRTTDNKAKIGGVIGRFANITNPTVENGKITEYTSNVKNLAYAGTVMTLDASLQTGNVKLNNELNLGQILGDGTNLLPTGATDNVWRSTVLFTNCAGLGNLVSLSSEGNGGGKMTFVNYIEGKKAEGTQIVEATFKIKEKYPDATFDASKADFTYSPAVSSLVPTSVAKMLDPNEPAMPNDPSYVPPVTDDTDDTTAGEESTAAPETNAPETNAPETNTPETKGEETSGTTDDAAEEGCASAVGFAVIVPVAAVAFAFVAKKKKD